MTGPKLNEKSYVVGESAGTKASAKYVRMSASKVRVVLDLIRGLPVRQADEVLQFTDREAAVTVRKVLASAVANAQHNDEQDPEELFVLACYADEGPTLKRFTPRARGRAGRINKRTAHITVVVARLDDERLEVVQARDAKRSAAGRRRGASAGGSAASRRERVERSRQRATALKSGDPSESDVVDTTAELSDDVKDEILDDQVTTSDETETDSVETETVEVEAPEAEADDTDAADTDAAESADEEKN